MYSCRRRSSKYKLIKVTKQCINLHSAANRIKKMVCTMLVQTTFETYWASLYRANICEERE